MGNEYPLHLQNKYVTLKRIDWLYKYLLTILSVCKRLYLFNFSQIVFFIPIECVAKRKQIS